MIGMQQQLLQDDRMRRDWIVWPDNNALFVHTRIQICLFLCLCVCVCGWVGNGLTDWLAGGVTMAMEIKSK